jgi:hypothetical protein
MGEGSSYCQKGGGTLLIKYVIYAWINPPPPPHRHLPLYINHLRAIATQIVIGRVLTEQGHDTHIIQQKYEGHRILLAGLFYFSAIERVRHMYAQMYIFRQTSCQAQTAGIQMFLVKTDERRTDR